MANATTSETIALSRVIPEHRQDRPAAERIPPSAPQAWRRTRQAIVQRRAETLFLHWRVDPRCLRACLPDSCVPDLHQGSAWLTISAFTVRRSRWAGLPIACGRDYAEIEIAACVRLGGAPALFLLRRETSRGSWHRLPRWLGFAPSRQAEIARERFSEADTLWDVRLPGGETWFRLWSRIDPGRATAPAALERFLFRRPVTVHLAEGGGLRIGAIQRSLAHLQDARAVVVVDKLTPSLGIDGLDALPALCHYAASIDQRLSRPRTA